MNPALKSLIYPLLPLTVTLSAACAPEPPKSAAGELPGAPPYVALDEELTQFKSDFNAMTDKLRLVFISGPSCGICLRGMDDLNQSIVASVQDDPRIHTFVLYVPTLGAEAMHAAAAVQLLPGARVSHYWDEAGRSGQAFQEALGISMYAWDVWMIYEPGARWDPDSTPPAPAFWQHQLPDLPTESRLDAKAFASTVTARLAKLPAAIAAIPPAGGQSADPRLLRVAQPLGFVIERYHSSRGGYRNLKMIHSIRYQGKTHVNGRTYPLAVETRRPHYLKRVISDGTSHSTIVWNGANLVREGSSIGLPPGIQDEVLASYDFDGWITEWKRKGHKLFLLGMKRFDDRLPWIIETQLTNGRNWHIYVDSHSGDAFRQALMNPKGEETLAVEFGDYRDVGEFRLPHEVRYYERDRLLATDRYEDIQVETTSPGKVSTAAHAGET